MNTFNFTGAPDSNLPASHQGMWGDPAETDPAMSLYDQYALPYESFEYFADRMSEDHGQHWISKLSRRTK